jgi:hypothetical protein
VTSKVTPKRQTNQIADHKEGEVRRNYFGAEYRVGRREALTLFAVTAGFLLATAAPAAAQTVGCAAPVGFFAPTPECASNCCLTLVPDPNALNLGAGICVDATSCNTTPRACSSGPSALSTSCDALSCPFNDTCCVTIVPNLSGVCAPGACGSGCGSGSPIPPIGATEGLVNQACGLLGQCVRIVTHALVGNSEVESERDILPAIGPLDLLPPQSIDVTGDGKPDLGVKVSIPLLPGVPPALATQMPTIQVIKLSGAPARLRVKVEAVTNSGPLGHKRSFGYDSRSSTAPRNFIAALDFSDRDMNPGTDQVRATLTIDPGASALVGVVTESFLPGSNLSEAQRTDRQITEIDFRADPANGTQVPASVSLDYTTSADQKHVVLTRSDPTTIDLLIDAPNHDPRITGTVSRLPQTVDLTIADKHPDGDSSRDLLGFDYIGGDIIPHAELKFDLVAHDLVQDPLGCCDPPGCKPDSCTEKQPPSCSGSHVVTHARTISTIGDQLPSEAHLAYDSGSRKVQYTATDRTLSVELKGEDEVEFFKRAKGFDLLLEDLPTTFEASLANGHIIVETPDDMIRLIQFDAQDVASLPLSPCEPAGSCDPFGDPTASGVILQDMQQCFTTGPFPYLLYARVHRLRSADLITDPDPDVYVDTAPDIAPIPRCEASLPGCESFRKFVARVQKANPLSRQSLTTVQASMSSLEPRTHMSYSHTGTGGTDPSADFRTIHYSNAGTHGSPDVTVDAENLPGLPTGSNGVQMTDLRVALIGIPNSLDFAYSDRGFPLKLRTCESSDCPGDDVLDELDVRLSSGGATDALPASELVDYNNTPDDPTDDTPRALDGVLLRDFTDRFVIDGRIRGLRNTTIDVNTNHPVEPCVFQDELCIALDTEATEADPRLRFDSQKGLPGFALPPPSPYSITKTEELFVTLDQIPRNLLARKTSQDVIYSAADRIPRGLELDENTIVGLFSNGLPVGDDSNDSRKQLRVTPLPKTLHTCEGDSCTLPFFGGDFADKSILVESPQESIELQLDDRPRLADPAVTLVDLTFNLFAVRSGIFADGSGYFGFDTGWDPNVSPPPQNQQMSGFIRIKNNAEERTLFSFAPGFASHGRRLDWDGRKHLLNGHLLTRSVTGDVTCPANGMLIFASVRQDLLVNASGFLDFDFTDEYCNR